MRRITAIKLRHGVKTCQVLKTWQVFKGLPVLPELFNSVPAQKFITIF